MARTPTDPTDLTPDAQGFLTDRHLASLTTLRRDGTPHVVAVGFTWDPERSLVRVITNSGSQKALNAERGGYAAVTQVDGPRWLTLEGKARVSSDPGDVAEAVTRYAGRYRQPRENPTRVVIEISVGRVLGVAGLLGR
ncbi:TIGR03618 family F420-dependent PPOX class oxidoreductase [Rhodococcus sp. Q]|uniref:pyridoxamine 5'-phosphate oxidase family protein n=1 Tax=Rhodococcus sp. Q TaxID=2502252 RepID=UPI0010F5608B|nr:TIGR03618 family F420-dependent PPOX class oxidoreductase [Rhodococcus sp. Q]